MDRTGSGRGAPAHPPARPHTPARVPPRLRTASGRIVRRVGLSLGIGGVVMGLVEVPEIIEQARVAAPWWGVTAALLAFGMYPVLAVGSIRFGARWIRAAGGVAAVSFLASVATLPFALHEHSIDSSSVWLYRILPLGAMAAGLAWRVRLSLAYLLIGSAAVAVADVYTVDRVTVPGTLSTFTRVFGLSLLFLWAMTSALSAGARLDRESAIAGRRAAAVAGASARDHERERFAALIHDAVLSTLLDASRTTGRSEVLRRQAEHTLAQLDAIRAGPRAPDVLDAPAAVVFLRSAVHEVNPDIRFTTRPCPGFDDLRMPVHAAGTMAAALAEAVRNSLRHAAVPGRAVRRAVTCSIGAGGIRLEFADDGAGFDVGRVPADRLGISVSILGRMRRLPGGVGFVESQPGQGTTVTLVWGCGG